MAINRDELPAYFNAATAVAAVEFQLPVERISLDVRAGRRDKPQLLSLKKYIASRIDRFNCLISAADYVTVLLAGPIGRAIGLEIYLGYEEPHIELARLERAYLQEARLCREPATDVALAIVVGWLKNYDGANWDATFEKLWRRADKMLRSKQHLPRVKRIVRELKRRKSLTGDEILRALGH